MSIEKSRTKKKFVYAGAALLAVVGIHQLIATGLAASILTQILAISLPILILGAVIGIPSFLFFQHIHYCATFEPSPEHYSAQAIATFRIQRQEWRDGLIAWIIVNLMSLVISFIIGSASQMPLLGVGLFVLMFIATTKSDRLVAYPTIEELKIRTRNAGDHGDASWATVDEVSQLKAFPNHWDEFGKGIFLGNRTNPYITLFDPHNKFESEAFNKAHFSYTGETNGITFAPPGGGKNTTAIIPTLLTSDESTFVLDVKVENFFVTSPARTDKGHEVILINPFNLFGKQIGNYDSFTHRFNPLANLDPNDPDFASDIRQIAAAMIIPDKGSDHFVNRAQNLVTCLIAHICSNEEELAAGQNNLPRVHEILGFSPKDFSFYMQQAAFSPLSVVRNNAGTFAAPDNKEIDGVKSTAHTQLSFLEQPQVAYFLSGHDFDFADMRKKKMTIYCMLELKQLQTNFRFARLMVQSLFNTLMTPPEHNDGRVLVLLDEQAQLKNMDVLETSSAIMRGYKVRVWSIFQNLNQIKSIYGEGWENFLSNAGFIQFFRPNDEITAKYISEKVGDETITEPKITTTRTPRIDANGRKVWEDVVGTGENKFPKKFLSPQDLLGMPDDRAIVFYAGMKYPIMISPEKYYEQNSSELTFHGFRYAPHPTHDEDALEWMRNYYAAEEP